MKNKNLLQLSDAELVKIFQSGNAEAYEALVERHSEDLKNFLTCLLINKTLVCDVLQDVWLAVFLKLQHGNYEEKNNFQKWLRTIAHHAAMYTSRTERKYVHDERKLNLLAVSGKEKNNHRKILYRALSHLSAHAQRIIVLHFFRGLSFKEISLQLGVTVGAVTSAYSVALKKLRAEIIPLWYL